MAPRDHPLVRRGVGHVLAGAAALVPFVLVALAAWAVYDALVGMFGPAYALARRVGLEGPLLVPVVTTVGAVLGLGLIGVVARHRYGERAVHFLDRAVSRIPGLGPIYDELSRTRSLIDRDADDRFTDVALVELVDGGHVLGFVVGEAPATVAEPVDDDLVTVYVPIAPSPTLGGHLFHLRPERLRETELTVQGALATLVTLGRNADDRESGDGGLNEMFNARQPADASSEQVDATDGV